MLETLARNYSYRNKAAKLYEIATVYKPVAGRDLADERPMLSLGAYGAGMDFFALKGVVEQTLCALNVKNVRFAARSDISAFHPGRCAEVTAPDGKVYAVFGELHPNVSKTYGFDVPVYVCICDTEKLLATAPAEKHYKPLPKFRAVERDLAFVCDESLTSGELKKAIVKYGGKMLESVEVFDIYRDAKIGENKKSMAYSLTLRSPEKTLEDADCDKIVYKILNGLERDFGVTLRS